ncbi:DNA polymerase III subunit alpha [bacterium]|nr:DNA polymerase III subunit alpha [bacterium]
MTSLGKFVHLHVHSTYSTLDGANALPKMVERVKELGMGSIALTDHGNLFGALSFQKACQAGGIHPVFGCETYLSPTTRTDRQSQQARTRYHFLMLAETLEGWQNLSKLVSLGFLEGFYYKPRIDWELLEQYSKGLIATTACIQGPICQAILENRRKDALALLDRHLQVFGRENFFIELMEHGIPEQRILNNALIELAREHNIRMIATNDCHYLTAKDYDAHDVMLAVQTGKQISDRDRLRFEQNEFYIKSPDQMEALFGNIDGALANTVAIAERCNVEIPLRQKLLPRYITPNGEPANEYLRGLVSDRLPKRYGDRLSQEHLDRAEMELGVIERMGYVDYFLVVWDFIDWAKRHAIPVGPGRGSGAGSIVAYAIGITDLDPLVNGLFFERFLNPERVSMPDFDVDFCFERRGEVIEYVRNKYGHDCVSQIITFGTMKARNSIRDVGRAMGMPLPKVDQVAKLVPGGPKVTLTAALGDDPTHPEFASADLKQLYDSDAEVHDLIEKARGLEGAIRQPGTHAAGVVICDKPLIDHIPLYRPAEEGAMPATQFTMTEVEEMGLLKMDFLGLKNLTLIQHCIDSINDREVIGLTAEKIPTEDDKAFEILQAGKGLGLFQLESSGMRKLLTDFRPTRFSDIVALISLYRPGPMDSIPDFIARKNGTTPIVYDHPDLEPILRETYGLFVYQEQVMQVAQALAGYTLGGADLLRREMSKKKAEEMAKERVKFTAGCDKRGIDRETATRVFDTMEKFAAYGFNKSHAAAYSVITMQTAWLKAHYPIDFYAALMTNEIGGDDAKMAMYFDEVRAEGILILPPDVNSSRVNFAADGPNIRFGLSAIKGVGANAVVGILAEREANGPFKSLQDFIARCDKRLINSKVIECLIKCGAFDFTGFNRPSLLAVMPDLLELAGSARKDATDNQTSLFDMMSEDDAADLNAETPVPRLPDWSDKERLETEKELVGYYLSGHPLDRFQADFDAFSGVSSADIMTLPKDEPVEWVGLIKAINARTDRKGQMFAFVTCEDRAGNLELAVFAEAFMKYRELIREGEMIFARGKVNLWNDKRSVVVFEVQSIDKLREDRVRAVEIGINWRQVSEAGLTSLLEIAARHRGRRKLWFVLKDGTGELRVEAGNGYGVQIDSTLIHDLQKSDLVQSMRYIVKKQSDEYR